MIEYSKNEAGPIGVETGPRNDDQPDDGGPTSDSIVIQVQSNQKPLTKSTKLSSLKYKCIPSHSRFTWRLLLGCFICLTLLLSVYFYIDKQYFNNEKLCLTPDCTKTAAYLLSSINFSVNPCDDFFEFACGTWNKVHVIPEDQSSISTFEVLINQLHIILKDILEKPPNKNDNDATIKAKTFYSTCINMTQIISAGDKTLKEILKYFGNWPITDKNWVDTNFSLETLLSKIHSDYNEGILVEQWVGTDDYNSSINIIQLDQSQLGLPSRDYYLQSSNVDDLDAYRTYIIELAVLLGADRDYARKEADKIVDFEIQLANVTAPESDNQEFGSIYKKLKLNQLRMEIPEINWTELLSSQMKLEEDEQIVVYRYNYFKKIVPILQNTDNKTIFNYVMWRLIMELSMYLTDDYQKERVIFRHKLFGVIAERSRFIQCVEWTNKHFGLAVGSLFIRDYFNPDSRNMATEMIHALKDAFKELLQRNSWMDEDTKSLAIDKANAIRERIGYPDMITNATKLSQEYAGLKITKEDFMDNLINALKFKSSENSKQLRQVVDKDHWFTDPTVVNAFYNPNKNDIVFPAGILQPLFYSSHLPKSINYGGIGVVIGHEITHGFDDKGRQFDKDGNMIQWWNDATIKAFRNQSQCIVDQYSRYKINEDGDYVNGKMTKGENIADNGGLKYSFLAYQKWVEKHGIEPNLPGLNFTHEQLFFLNYAQIWCGTMRSNNAISKIRSSSHCPGQIRVIGPLSNSHDFAKAYNCPIGSPMNPETKCTIW